MRESEFRPIAVTPAGMIEGRDALEKCQSGGVYMLKFARSRLFHVGETLKQGLIKRPLQGIQADSKRYGPAQAICIPLPEIGDRLELLARERLLMAVIGLADLQAVISYHGQKPRGAWRYVEALPMIEWIAPLLHQIDTMIDPTPRATFGDENLIDFALRSWGLSGRARSKW